ncbi:Xaa-Pro peptidase family protein [Porphyromonas sp.]|uniref:M24 family metallopeptidase n=1 Tax=Porphyromonas sp. TaxID=1924944 RepID=UPI0026DC44EF|nr:Xaa-Pro peptidase family protein [Porphyromonas sp.]MDO4695680.1 Xaa-Pro peptidase family protein [Porphyromonas sp.]MDO4771496.1 Xaa-Pro peptidase family protein [Porphyromonas sp.]
MNITKEELLLRCQKVSKALVESGCDSILLRSIPNHIYLTGSVFLGFTFLKVGHEPIFFAEKPSQVLDGYDRTHNIRKPEQMPEILAEYGYEITEQTCIEASTLPFAEYQRLSKLSKQGVFSFVDASVLMRNVRSIKTPTEIEIIRSAAIPHMEIYKIAPSLFKKGMTDLEWQFAIEYEMRKRGSIGVFRCFGSRMEIFMGNIAAGINANVSAPYDFTMGGAGAPAMPMGACGQPITEGMALMLDMAGNYSPYNTDITRVYACGQIEPEAVRAHNLSIEMHRYFQSHAKPGVELSEIYNHCAEMSEEAGLSRHFMGQDHQVKFVGHGVGIEINEPPVMTPRWKGVFEPGMTMAFEPKFVIAPTGALGVENTYLVTENGVENLTPLPEEIVYL